MYPIDSLTPSHSTGPQAKDQGATGGIPMCWNILGRHRYEHVSMLYLVLVSQHSSEVTTHTGTRTKYVLPTIRT